jgi:hypothetical protein
LFFLIVVVRQVAGFNGLRVYLRQLRGVGLSMLVECLVTIVDVVRDLRRRVHDPIVLLLRVHQGSDRSLFPGRRRDVLHIFPRAADIFKVNSIP